MRLRSNPIIHTYSPFPALQPPPKATIVRTFVLAYLHIVYQVPHTPGQAAASVARPVAGYHDIFCASSKLLAKLKNIVA